MEYVIKHYKKDNNSSPFEEWINHLKDCKNQIRILLAIERMALGNFNNCKSLGDGICELKLYFGSGYRVYFGIYNNQIIILLCGGDKSSQSKDVALAKKYWNTYLESMKGNKNE